MKLRASLVVAAVALTGSIGPALAEAGAPVTTAAPAVAESPVELPRFVPSPEAVAAEAESGQALVEIQEPALAPLAPAPVENEVVEDIPDGVASWYGPGFAGRKTASGERFDPSQFTAAHRTLPFGSKVRVTHNGRSVVVRINDRGPFHGGRVIDLSQAAAEELGLRRAGSGKVQLELLAS